MARPARTPINGRVVPRKPVSHAKDPVDDDHDDDEQGLSSGQGDDTPAVAPPVDALSEMMASLQGASTSRITVYRIVKNNPPSYVFECDPTSFSMDDLRDKYNGGEFRLYVMKDGRLWKNMRVVVEPKQIFHGQDPAAPAATPVTEMMAVMRDGFAAQAAALRETLATRTVSPFAGMDWPAVITAAAAALTALRPPAAPPAPDTTAKALEMFMAGLDMANSVRENAGGGEGGIGGMLREVLRSPIVAAAVQQALPSPQRPPQAAPPPALPNPSAPQVSHAKPAEPTNPPQQDETKVLAYYLGFLCGKAQTDATASLYAELVLDNVPDAQLTPLLARGDQLIDYLIEIHPPVAQHRQWFIDLIKEINELLAPEDEGSEQVGEAHATDTATVVVPGHAA